MDNEQTPFSEHNFPLALSPQPSATDAQGSQVFQIVLEDLKQRIRVGQWSPGQRLPSIMRLASELAVSTSSLREVLRSLQSMGLVKIEHGRGVFVTSLRPLADPTSQKVTLDRLVAMAEARHILEPELAALAAERGTDEELAEIERLALHMEAAVRQGIDAIMPDLEFHRRIAQAAHNPVLYEIMEGINELFLESRRITSAEPGITERAVRYHLLIAEATCHRNASQARLLMLAHMKDALHSILAARNQ